MVQPIPANAEFNKDEYVFTKIHSVAVESYDEDGSIATVWDVTGAPETILPGEILTITIPFDMGEGYPVETWAGLDLEYILEEYYEYQGDRYEEIPSIAFLSYRI